MREVAGGCHCGAVRYRAKVESLTALKCNCSICKMKGFVHVIVAASSFELLSGANVLTSYRFNTGVADHLFCARCGVQSYYRPRSHPDSWSLNLQCLDQPDSGGFEVKPFDGENWEANVESIR